MNDHLPWLTRHTASLYYSLFYSSSRMNDPLNDLSHWYLLRAWLLYHLSLWLYPCLHPLLDHLPTLDNPLCYNLPLGINNPLLNNLTSLVHNYLATMVDNLAL